MPIIFLILSFLLPSSPVSGQPISYKKQLINELEQLDTLPDLIEKEQNTIDLSKITEEVTITDTVSNKNSGTQKQRFRKNPNHPTDDFDNFLEEEIEFEQPWGNKDNNKKESRRFRKKVIPHN